MTKPPKIALSKIDKLGLDEIWENENHFTEWLAKGENNSIKNISILSEEIGIYFENIKTQFRAGRFIADIVADVAGGDGTVVIENQIKPTNHNHLGQIITYASTLDAKFVLWIVTDFTEEHHEAIDWLNRNISEGINFFLIQVEVYKIDNSEAAAPKFNVICKPNDWSKLAQRLASGDEVSGTQLLQMEYWDQLIKASEKSKTSLKFSAKARPDPFYMLSFGKGGVHIELLMHTTKKQFRCEFYIEDNKKLFDDLEAKKDNIEADLASLEGDLKWERLDDNVKKSRIFLTKDGDLRDKKSWNELNEWCIKTSDKFVEVFSRYLPPNP